MNKLMTTVNQKLGRGGLVLKKYSPEIMIGLGLGSLITSTVLACKATLKAKDILREQAKDLETIEKASKLADEDPKVDYPVEERKKETAVVKARTVWKMAKNYAPAAFTGLLGVSLILGAHHIQNRRITALAASYEALRGEYERYRKSVIERLGEEEERELKAARFTEEQKSIETAETPDVAKSFHYIPSEYARFFDETNIHWQRHHEYNLLFLKQVQNEMNTKLDLRGHVFLNDVYTALGFPRTSYGAVVGWYKPKNSENAKGRDCFVDFGIFNPDNEKARDFINGYERSILLDFNVDGIIYDLI